MQSHRFSIRTLLGAMGLVGVGLAAFRFPWIWLRPFIALCFVIHLAAALAAIYRRGVQRVFWIGFLIVGWPHVMAVLWSEKLGLGLQEWMPPYSLLMGLNDQYSLGLTYTSVQAAQLMWAIVMATVGGYLAQFLFCWKKPAKDSNGVTEESTGN
jgi:hypothetical protein